MQWRSRTWALVFASIFVAIGCTSATTPSPSSSGPGGNAASPAQGGSGAGTKDTLTVAMATDIDSWDPMVSNSKSSSLVMDHVFDRLVVFDKQGKLQGQLATAWKILDDHQTWQLTLRQGVTFQDGEAFSATTLKYALDRGLDPNNKFTGGVPGYDFTTIGLKRVEIVDERTVNLVTDRFEPDTPGYLAEVPITSAKYYQSNSKEVVAAKPNGSGPYRMTRWVPGDRITLERWDGYWGPKPTIKTITFRTIPEASSRVAELLAGSVDVINNVPPDQAAQINASQQAKVVNVTGGRRIFIAFSQVATGPGAEAVRDVRVRQALNYAVDVDKILHSLLQGQGSRGAGIVNPPWECSCVKPYAYDPAKAKELLTQAGYPQGFKATMSTPNGRYQKDKEIALAVAADLAKVGVQVDVTPLDWSTTYQELLRTKKFPPMFLLGAGSSFLSAWYDLADLEGPATNTNNFPQWDNKEFNELVAQLGKTYDSAARTKITDRMQQIVHDDAPWLFLYMQVDWYGINRSLNWQPPHDELMDFKDVSFGR